MTTQFLHNFRIFSHFPAWFPPGKGGGILPHKCIDKMHSHTCSHSPTPWPFAWEWLFSPDLAQANRCGRFGWASSKCIPQGGVDVPNGSFIHTFEYFMGDICRCLTLNKKTRNFPSFRPKKHIGLFRMLACPHEVDRALWLQLCGAGLWNPQWRAGATFSATPDTRLPKRSAGGGDAVD